MNRNGEAGTERRDPAHYPGSADHPAPQRDEELLLGTTSGERIAVSLFLVACGLLLGWLIPIVARWSTTLPWVPFQGPLELIAELKDGWGMAAMLAAGLVLGIALAFYVMHELLTIGLSGNQIRFLCKGEEKIIPREQISAVFLEKKQIVVLGRNSEELHRSEDYDSKLGKLKSAFQSYEYPWHEEDPFLQEYKRWVPESSELPVAVDALFKARQKALNEGDQDDAQDLKREIGRTGYTIRDEKKRQYWRSHGSSHSP